MHQPSIAILGAGPAGLTLAGLLHRAKINYTVYEKDESASWAFGRSGSGTLDLHTNGGLLAIDKLGLRERFNALARHNVPFAIADAQGKVHLALEGEDENDKPEIDRRDLRELLLDSVPTESVRWGSKVQAVRKAGDGSMEVHLADGSVKPGFRLVVGADGHWSKARELVTTAKPVYRGVTAITAWLHQDNPHYPTAASLAGEGLYVALGDNKGLVIARLRSGTYQIGAMLRVPETWRIENAALFTDTGALRQTLSQEFSDWSDPLLNILKNISGPIHPWSQYSLPLKTLEASKWQHVPGVTLIGDAAHLTVSGGHGVNSAMLDAYSLADKIAAHGLDDIEGATTAYEAEMLPRARATLVEADVGLERMIHPDAPGSWVELLVDGGGDGD